MNVVKYQTLFHDPTSDEDRHQIKIAATVVSGEHLHCRCVILLPPTLVRLIIDGAAVVHIMAGGYPSTTNNNVGQAHIVKGKRLN